MDLLFIITLLLITSSVIVFILMVVKSSKHIATSANPIDTITLDGCLGFKIGDSKKFVMSRIEHLNLLTKYDKKVFDKMKELRMDKNMIATSTGLFNNIENVIFGFNDTDQLYSIFINLNNKLFLSNDLKSQLLERLSILLNKNYEYFNSEDVFRWRNNRECILLSNKSQLHIAIYKDEIDE